MHRLIVAVFDSMLITMGFLIQLCCISNYLNYLLKVLVFQTFFVTTLLRNLQDWLISFKSFI